MQTQLRKTEKNNVLQCYSVLLITNSCHFKLVEKGKNRLNQTSAIISPFNSNLMGFYIHDKSTICMPRQYAKNLKNPINTTVSKKKHDILNPF